jgi:uncharacterized protein
MNTKIQQIVKEVFSLIDPANIKVDGELGRRIDITIKKNLLQIDIEKDFLASFKNKTDKDSVYIGIGKLIDALVRFATHTNDEKILSIKKYIIDTIIKTQEADGYIGNMTPENRMWKLWDIHEMGYIIYGLIIDYKYFNNKQSLLAAEKAADYIIKNWPSMPGDWEKTTTVKAYVAVTGLPYTLLNLFEITGNKRYLEFCLNELNLKNWNPGIIIGRRKYIEGHVYGYLAMCLAQLEIYKIKPEDKLLDQTIQAMNFMTEKSGMTITGGVGQVEVWTDDQDGRGDLGETCATAYQLRIYDNLLRLKGDSIFGDTMERTIYNALFGAQSPDGRQIRYFTPFEGNRVYHNGDTYCCPNNYRRIIAELPSMIYYRAEKGLMINLYTSSKINVSLEGGVSLSLRQETDYPNSGHILIHVDPSEPKSFPLQLRIPSWSKSVRVLINGIPLEEKIIPGTFAVIERLWKAGDKVTLDIPMEWRLVKGRQRQAGRAAIMRGPQLFCLNPEQNELLAEKDGADLGKIVIDLKSIEQMPVPENSVRPDGIGCRIKAGYSAFGMGNEGNLTLTLTEFADQKGRCIYFRVPDLSEAENDEFLDQK